MANKTKRVLRTDRRFVMMIRVTVKLTQSQR